MKKLLLGALAAVVVIAVAAGVFLYSSIDSLVKAAIEDYVPDITQTPVKVGSVKLAPTDGVGKLHGLVLGNPKGFRTPHALSAGVIELAIDPASVTRDVVLVRKVAVIAADINYETSDAGSNFDVIQRNVDGFVKRNLGKSGTPDKDKPKGPGKKLIIEHLSIHDAKVSYAPALLQGKSITVPLPNIDLRNLGKARGGATPAQLTSEVMGAIKAQVMQAVTQPIRGVGDTIKGLFK